MRRFLPLAAAAATVVGLSLASPASAATGSGLSCQIDTSAVGYGDCYPGIHDRPAVYQVVFRMPDVNVVAWSVPGCAAGSATCTVKVRNTVSVQDATATVYYQLIARQKTNAIFVFSSSATAHVNTS